MIGPLAKTRRVMSNESNTLARGTTKADVECGGCRTSPLRLKLPLVVWLDHLPLESAAADLWTGVPQQLLLTAASLLLDPHLAVLTTTTPSATPHRGQGSYTWTHEVKP